MVKAQPSAREQHLYKGQLRDVLAVDERARKRKKKKEANPLSVRAGWAKAGVWLALEHCYAGTGHVLPACR